MKPGAVWIQMSTIGVEGTERAWRVAQTRPEIVFVDAPFRAAKPRRRKPNWLFLRPAIKPAPVRRRSNFSTPSEPRHTGWAAWARVRE